MSEKKKTLHVDKLTIKADQIFLEGPRPEPRRMSRDEFLFGRRRVEESTESGEQPVQRRRNPFLSGSVWGPEEEKGKESSSAEESRAEESKDSDEKKESSDEVESSEHRERESRDDDRDRRRRRPFSWI